jgi:hypothetical protein
MIAIACGGTTPSKAPLAPPTAHVDQRVRPSSSRAVDANEETEEPDALEIVVQPSDDDDDSTVRRNGPPDCTQLPAASSCLGASLARKACETVGPAVDPRVGAAWLACMRDPGSGSDCDSHRIVTCGLRAVNQAKTDGAYLGFCTQIAAQCTDMADEITTPVCEHLIAAWKPDRRTQMLDCLRHGCETGGFGACLP